MHLNLIVQFLVLLAFANMTPVVAKKIFGSVAAAPLDGGLLFIDGRPFFGPSKTIRGVAASIFFSSIGAPLVGSTWRIGALVAIFAVAGDLSTSFLKRRLAFASSSRAIGLDQIPESLLPAAVCAAVLPLTVLDIVVITIAFSLAALAIQFGLSLPHRPAEGGTLKPPR